MRLRSRIIAAACGSALVATAALTTSGTALPGDPSGTEPPAAEVAAVARDLRISEADARKRLRQQVEAHAVAKQLPKAVTDKMAGKWFDAGTGKLTVAITDQAVAGQVRAAGAQPKLVTRGQADLDRIKAAVRRIVGNHTPGLNSFGIDVVNNEVTVTVNRLKVGRGFLDRVNRLGGVRVIETDTSPVQQAGDVKPGNPWWPGGESNCSVGFGATNPQGAKFFVTAGHCTDNANQAAYGASGQQNRIGTSNVGGTGSYNNREGDFGLVNVTEAGWNLSASVAFASPAITVTGAEEAIVGDAVCHSGNTAPTFECGTVTKVNQEIDYGHIVEGLTITTACSQGGDSGGAWLKGSKAVGVHSGAVNGNSCPAGDNAIFQPVIEAFTKWNLTLLTGGGGGEDDEPPTTPGNPRSTGSTDTTVSLAWDASVDNVGVTGYDVYNGSALATTVATTSATVSGLTADTAYSFTIQAKDAAGNKSKPTLPVSARTQPGGGRTFTNGTDYPIRDFQVTISTVRSTATGRATNPITVKVTATHTCIQDLNIRVVSPSGRSYWLQQYGGYPCTAFPGTKTWTVTPASTENAAGTWTLRIGDNGPDDIGVLDTWSITV